MLVAQPVDTASDLGASLFVLLLVIAGAVAAGFFFTSPLRRRRARGNPPPLDDDGPWSTRPADAAGSGDAITAQPSASLTKPWSTSEQTDDPLQHTR